MKLRLSELRNIIRSVILEAPLSDVDPVIFPGKSQYKFGDEDLNKEDDHIKKLRTMMKSPGYKKLAIKNYKNLGTEIHIVGLPLPTGISNGETIDRIRIVPASEVKSYLEDHYGFELDEEIMDQLEGYVRAGHGVLVAAMSQFEVGFTPTPWMIVHAICDTEGENPVSSIVNMIWSEDDMEMQPGFEIPHDVLINSLTMKSAINGDINPGSRDMICEIVTQEILTTAGFTYKPTGNPEYDGVLESIKSLLKDENPRKKFDDMIRGKMVIVEVYD